MDYKKKTIEEKAKRYDEAIERAKDFMNGEVHCALRRGENIMCWIFPELRESEDERTVKDIICYLRVASQYVPQLQKEEWIAWLEKQGEQKSLDDIAKEVTKDKDAAVSFFKSAGIINENGELADEYKIEQGEQKSEEVDNLHNYLYGEQESSEWSEEDESLRRRCIGAIDMANLSDYTKDSLLNWLKSLKDRVQTKPKQEWSEEDERMLNGIIHDLEYPGVNYYKKPIEEKVMWLKSLRPQNHWKPSEEQIKVCKEVYADLLSAKGFDVCTVNSELNRLEEQIKKLRKE